MKGLVSVAGASPSAIDLGTDARRQRRGLRQGNDSTFIVLLLSRFRDLGLDNLAQDSCVRQRLLPLWFHSKLLPGLVGGALSSSADGTLLPMILLP